MEATKKRNEPCYPLPFPLALSAGVISFCSDRTNCQFLALFKKNRNCQLYNLMPAVLLLLVSTSLLVIWPIFLVHGKRRRSEKEEKKSFQLIQFGMQNIGFPRMYCVGHEFVVVWLAALLTSGLCQDNCPAPNGIPGEEGIPGRGGLPGEKGQKGEAAPLVDSVMRTGLKGDQGDRGLPGPAGHKGYRGDLGPMGLPGPQGPRGRSGDGSSPLMQQSAFSVERTSKDKPGNSLPVTFDRVLTDIKKDFNLRTGYFTCKVAGAYYFVFQSMSMGNLCLALKSDALDAAGLGFCDYNKRGTTQLISGGAVLQLTQGQRVWVEPFKEEGNFANHMTNSQSRSIVFSGFLIFPNGD